MTREDQASTGTHAPLADNVDAGPDPMGSTIGGTPRAVRRPRGVTVPAHWAEQAKYAPAPEVVPPPSDPLDPVRFGDWERKGIAIDF